MENIHIDPVISFIQNRLQYGNGLEQVIIRKTLSSGQHAHHVSLTRPLIVPTGLRPVDFFLSISPPAEQNASVSPSRQHLCAQPSHAQSRSGLRRSVFR